jgi:hypothetical protein
MSRTVRNAWAWNADNKATTLQEVADCRVWRNSRYPRLGFDYTDAEMIRMRRKARQAGREACQEGLEDY